MASKDSLPQWGEFYYHGLYSSPSISCNPFSLFLFPPSQSNFFCVLIFPSTSRLAPVDHPLPHVLQPILPSLFRLLSAPSFPLPPPSSCLPPLPLFSPTPSSPLPPSAPRSRHTHPPSTLLPFSPPLPFFPTLLPVFFPLPFCFPPLLHPISSTFLILLPPSHTLLPLPPPHPPPPLISHPCLFRSPPPPPPSTHPYIPSLPPSPPSLTSPPTSHSPYPSHLPPHLPPQPIFIPPSFLLLSQRPFL